MRKYLVILLLALLTNCQAQITPVPIFRIQTDSATFTRALMAGSILSDIGSGKTYRILRAVSGSSSLKTLTINLDYVPFVATEADPVVSALIGLVKSNGSVVSAAIPGVDYLPTYNLMYPEAYTLAHTYYPGELIQYENSLGTTLMFICHTEFLSTDVPVPSFGLISNCNLVYSLPDIPEAQIQSDWTESNNSATDYIKNKPYVISDRQMILKIASDAMTTTTGNGKLIFCIPSEMTGFHLTKVEAFSTTAGTSVTTLMIRNATNSADMLSTSITIDANELTSYTATPSVIIALEAEVSTGDMIAIDVDAIGAGSKGLGVIFTFNYVP